jgi:glycerol uptake facilitator-like aquaporin
VALDVRPAPGPAALRTDLVRRLAAEALGTALLLTAVVGSGITAGRLSDDAGLQLLASAAATAAALTGLILVFGAVSGAHLNPAVTLAGRLLGTIGTRDAVLYAAAQTAGAGAGALLANAMFERPLLELAGTERAAGSLWLSEVVATAGLLLVVHGCERGGRSSAVPFAVGAWIGGAYLWTSSTSVANPAATVARTLSDSLAGIAPPSVPMFVLAQLVGAVVAAGVVRLLLPAPEVAP